MASDSFSVVYLNAEGKANTDHQLRVILETVRKRQGNSWPVSAISEADYRWSEEYESSWVNGHFVQRFCITGGRAAKIVWKERCQDYSRGVVWAGRSCRVDVDIGNAVQTSLHCFAKLSFIVAHLAHGDSWWDSWDDVSLLLSGTPRGYQKHVVGDLNVEGKLSAENDESREKWTHMNACLSAVNLTSALPHTDDAITRRPSGANALLHR